MRTDDQLSHVTLPERRNQADIRLNRLTLNRGRRGVRWPSFDPRGLSPGILHFGCGVFHRAHQNVFTQRAIELERGSDSAWGVLGVSFRRKQIKQLLAPQDYLYTVLERGQDTTTAEVVGVLKGVLFAGEEQEAIIAALKNPRTRIITLTVTPSGYSGTEADQDVQSSASEDAMGLLVAGLAAVRVQGTPPPVLISCDNIPHNGRRLREALVERARKWSPSLGSWIDRNVQFPSSVVDRIVPSPTSADRETASELLGFSDLAAISTEPFRQWVIEDFDGPRPPWQLAGAHFVSDVTPWEASKLNLLNGTHMAIAFLGILAGLEAVSDFVRDPLFAKYVARLMRDEQIPTIPKSDHDLVAYSRQLLQRWQNVNIFHRLQRIARNGSEKLEPRLLASLYTNMTAGQRAPCTVLAVAAWVCCAGRLMPLNCNIEDTAGRGLQEAAASCAGDTKRLLQLLLQKQEIFGCELPRLPAFEQELNRAVDCLTSEGVRGAVSKVLDMPKGSSW
jgi:fructuronate reductase